MIGDAPGASGGKRGFYEENNENVMQINKYTAVPDKQTEKKRAVIVKPDFTKK